MADRFLRRSYRILEATEPSEYNALSSANKSRYQLIISAGVVDYREGSLVRTVLWGIFGAGSETRANLEALIPDPPVEE